MLPPDNLALAISSKVPGLAEEVSRLYKGDILSVEEALLCLGKYAKIRVWFKEPVTVRINPRWRQTSIDDEGRRSFTRNHSRTDTCHVFSGFFAHGSQLCYKTKKDGRKGYYFEWLDLIERYELVLKGKDAAIKNSHFKNYEEFKKKFHPDFISEVEIQKLWNGYSSQHGGKYTRQDFHKIGTAGREVLRRFLEKFSGISKAPNKYYLDSVYDDCNYKVLKERHVSRWHTGRDISISHQTNCDYVFYSSEFSGCCNGRYGLLANKSEFLWTEDD